ncbi:hypothetical protein [Ammoniphilus sp. CFH 90114]|uniref:hypothetical protein n=1 Tax=Ammoniphilus sp. CFH 90114 TaxID=2493665 RepID=UPI0013E90AA9|nr:hypothetical protein [Ammoniphilus sp. CFH 90114]
MGFMRKKANEQRQLEQECSKCNGKGFYQYGLEFVHIHECPACDGSGEEARE